MTWQHARANYRVRRKWTKEGRWTAAWRALAHAIGAERPKSFCGCPVWDKR